MFVCSHLLSSAPLCYANFSHLLCSWACSFTLLTPLWDSRNSWMHVCADYAVHGNNHVVVSTGNTPIERVPGDNYCREQVFRNSNQPTGEWASLWIEQLEQSEWSEYSKAEVVKASEWSEQSERCERMNIASDQVVIKSFFSQKQPTFVTILRFAKFHENTSLWITLGFDGSFSGQMFS